MGIKYVVVSHGAGRADWFFTRWHEVDSVTPKWSRHRLDAAEFEFHADAVVVVQAIIRYRRQTNVVVEPRLDYGDLSGWFARHPMSYDDKWESWKRTSEAYEQMQAELERLDSLLRAHDGNLPDPAAKTLLVMFDHVRLEAVLMSAYAKEVRN